MDKLCTAVTIDGNISTSTVPYLDVDKFPGARALVGHAVAALGEPQFAPVLVFWLTIDSDCAPRRQGTAGRGHAYALPLILFSLRLADITGAAILAERDSLFFHYRVHCTAFLQWR